MVGEGLSKCGPFSDPMANWSMASAVVQQLYFALSRSRVYENADGGPFVFSRR